MKQSRTFHYLQDENVYKWVNFSLGYFIMIHKPVTISYGPLSTAVVVCTVSSIYAPEAFKSFRVDTWWPPSLVFFFPSHSVCEDDQL